MSTTDKGQERKVLSIDYDERDEAKKAAGKLANGENALGFDKELKTWYAKPGADLEKLKKWFPENKTRASQPPTDPRDEFADALVSAGFEIDGLPAMDGKKHRVRVDGDKSGQKSGVYQAYLDGRPAGWYQNHREHSEPVKWISSGQRIDPAELTQLRAEAAQKLQEREIKQAIQYDHNAHRSSQAHSLMPDATGNEPYLANKGVKAFPGVKVDKQGRVVVPLHNTDSEIRSLQRINETGFKSLKKNAQKTGNYFVVGGELKNGEPVLYAEGYSTAASISEATKRPVVMTVDAGNLPKVAESLKDRYPDSQHVVLGDDDRYKETNKGRDKALEAAAITNGVAQFPKFSNPKEGLTDFNDLHKAEGLNAVKEQVEAVIANNQIKVETMNEDVNAKPQTVKEQTNPGAVVTPKFEQEMDAALNMQFPPELDNNADFADYMDYANNKTQSTPAKTQNSENELQQIRKPETSRIAEREVEALNVAPAAVAIDDVEDKKPAPAAVAIDDVEDKKTAPAAVDIENSIEPYVEQQKSQTADNDVREWLNTRRVSAAEMIAEDNAREKRHAASIQPESLENESVNKQPKPQQQEEYFSEEKHKPVIPDRVAKSYTQVEDRFYFQGRPDSLAFVDKGAKLQTKISNAQVAGSLVEIAEARGWEEIQLKGTPEFRREAWLQATARGMTAKGYSPKEEDLARLKEVSAKAKVNEVAAGKVSEGEKQPVSTSKASNTESNVSQEASAKSASENTTATKKERPVQLDSTDDKAEKTNPLEGVLKEHGKAPFDFKKDNKENYYVKLENGDGQEKVHWGLDLERAIDDSGVQKGDKVELARTGRKEVIVEEKVKDKDGQVVGVKEIATHRNTWEIKADAIRDRDRPAAEVVKEHPDLINEIATVKLAEKFSQNMDDKSKAAFMDKVREKLANDVQQGKQAPEVKIKETRTTSKALDKQPEVER